MNAMMFPEQKMQQTNKKGNKYHMLEHIHVPETSLFCSLVFHVGSTAAVASTSKVSTAAKSTTAQILHWKTKFPPPCQSLLLLLLNCLSRQVADPNADLVLLSLILQPLKGRISFHFLHPSQMTESYTGLCGGKVWLLHHVNPVLADVIAEGPFHLPSRMPSHLQTLLTRVASTARESTTSSVSSPTSATSSKYLVPSSGAPLGPQSTGKAEEKQS